ncbi:MAG: endopeptidase La [Lachnospiraceae bacterium]
MESKQEMINVMPMVALRGLTVLPEVNIHFDVSRQKSIDAVEAAMEAKQVLFLSTQKDSSMEHPGITDLEKIGCVVKIKQITKMPSKIVRVLVEGITRAAMEGVNEDKGYLEAEILPLSPVSSIDEQEQKAMKRHLEGLVESYIQVLPKVGKGIVAHIEKIEQIGKLMDSITVTLPLPTAKRQLVLNAVELQERFEVLSLVLEEEIYIAKIRKEYTDKVRAKVDKNQKEYVLREQLKVIKEELGEDNISSDADVFMEKLSVLEASEEVKEKIEKQIKRFRAINNNSSEASVERNYIETLLELPWDRKTTDKINLSHAQDVLEFEHYGLEKVKERILEFLAVRAYNSKGASPIVCLVGPPGTGKSSIAKSIATALDKEYVRISLGGVHDEAEIRGHRKTYIGAMPGRIMVGLKHAGVKNPVMLLDEIDKVGVDHRGDAFAALLEVLDSEQNKQFRDHYVELPADLSEILFIATANDLSTIPRPLVDRMDIIEVNSYTANEKFHIAKEHLLPKQAEKHGLTRKEVSISDTALKKIIASYTREAGVRSLERYIAELYRKAARKLLTDKQTKVKITASNISNFLGKEKYQKLSVNKKAEVGIVRGLAWTSVGGDTLEIQVNTMPGKGNLALTGQMGDVMQESAKIAYTYVRSIASDYGVAKDYFETHNFHLHIPAGAVPKDGPSAGVTMATALLSACAGKEVDHLTAMTGEVNLRGKVMPIGGLKEKLLAANMAGVKQVLIPMENEKDLSELTSEIIGDMMIRTVSTMEEVLKYALVN